MSWNIRPFVLLFLNVVGCETVARMRVVRSSIPSMINENRPSSALACFGHPLKRVVVRVTRIDFCLVIVVGKLPCSKPCIQHLHRIVEVLVFGVFESKVTCRVLIINSSLFHSFKDRY